MEYNLAIEQCLKKSICEKRENMYHFLNCRLTWYGWHGHIPAIQ